MYCMAVQLDLIDIIKCAEVILLNFSLSICECLSCLALKYCFVFLLGVAMVRLENAYTAFRTK